MLSPDGIKKNETIPEWIYSVITLFNRCEQLKCLPETGGLLEQNEVLMKCFDVIRSEYGKLEQLRVDKQTQKIESKRRR